MPKKGRDPGSFWDTEVQKKEDELRSSVPPGARTSLDYDEAGSEAYISRRRAGERLPNMETAEMARRVEEQRRRSRIRHMMGR